MSESGGHKDGFLGQLMTGAVFMNNLYDHKFVENNSQINKDTMCQLFSYEHVYTSRYCNYTFSKIAGVTEEQKKQLMTVARILLSKKFTIPKKVLGEGRVIDWGSIGVLWGRANTGVGSTYLEFSYSKYDSPLSAIDIYGNSVSTDFSTYQEKANSLYNKYLK